MLKRIIPFVMALAMIFTMGAAFASSSASAAIVPVSMTVAGEGTITVTLVNENEAAEDIVNAVDKVLEAGYKTADLAHGAPCLTTVEMTNKIIEVL